MPNQKKALSKKDFFSILWERAPRELHTEMRYSLSQSFGEGRIYSVWGKTGEEEEWLGELEQAFGTSPHNMHFTPAPRNIRSGSKAAVACVPALWTDIDNKSPEQISDILNNLKDLEIPPCLLVSSGWGTYFFWLLESPATDPAEAEYGNKLVALLSEGDLEAVNISHTLRAPGSKNWKTSVPKDVKPFLLRSERYEWKGLYKKLCSYGAMLDFYNAPSKGSSRKREARQESGKEAQRRGDFPSWAMPLDGEGREDWTSLLEKEPASRCPLLRTAIGQPDNVGYREWLSLGSAFRIGFQDDQEGERAFHSLSRLSALKYRPADCSSKWAEIRDKELNPWGCEKLPRGVRCPLLGECRGILSVLGRTLPKKREGPLS